MVEQTIIEHQLTDQAGKLMQGTQLESVDAVWAMSAGETQKKAGQIDKEQGKLGEHDLKGLTEKDIPTTIKAYDENADAIPSKKTSRAKSMRQSWEISKRSEVTNRAELIQLLLKHRALLEGKITPENEAKVLEALDEIGILRNETQESRAEALIVARVLTGHASEVLKAANISNPDEQLRLDAANEDKERTKHGVEIRSMEEVRKEGPARYETFKVQMETLFGPIENEKAFMEAVGFVDGKVVPGKVLDSVLRAEEIGKAASASLQQAMEAVANNDDMSAEMAAVAAETKFAAESASKLARAAMLSSGVQVLGDEAIKLAEARGDMDAVAKYKKWNETYKPMRKLKDVVIAELPGFLDGIIKMMMQELMEVKGKRALNSAASTGLLAMLSAYVKNMAPITVGAD